MAAPKGHPRYGGREAGTANKLTRDAKQAIELAFEGIGGVEALTAWAKDNLDAFYSRVWTRIVPKDVSIEVTHKLETIIAAGIEAAKDKQETVQ